MKLSEIISKKVFSIEEGCEIGYVLNFSLDQSLSKIESFVIVSLQEENEFVLSYEEVKAITEEAVFISSSKTLLFDANFEPNNPLMKKVFSLSGQSLGKVVDIEANKKSIKKIETNCCEILPKHIYSSGKDCLFFSKNKAKKLKIIEKNNEIEVKIQKIQFPQRERGKGIDLIGRKIIKDILDKNHIVLFRKGETISPKNLIEAKERGVMKVLSENCI